MCCNCLACGTACAITTQQSTGSDIGEESKRIRVLNCRHCGSVTNVDTDQSSSSPLSRVAGALKASALFSQHLAADVQNSKAAHQRKLGSDNQRPSLQMLLQQDQQPPSGVDTVHWLQQNTVLTASPTSGPHAIPELWRGELTSLLSADADRLGAATHCSAASTLGVQLHSFCQRRCISCISAGRPGILVSCSPNPFAGCGVPGSGWKPANMYRKHAAAAKLLPLVSISVDHATADNFVAGGHVNGVVSLRLENPTEKPMLVALRCRPSRHAAAETGTVSDCYCNDSGASTHSGNARGGHPAASSRSLTFVDGSGRPVTPMNNPIPNDGMRVDGCGDVSDGAIVMVRLGGNDPLGLGDDVADDIDDGAMTASAASRQLLALLLGCGSAPSASTTAAFDEIADAASRAGDAATCKKAGHFLTLRALLQPSPATHTSVPSAPMPPPTPATFVDVDIVALIHAEVIAEQRGESLVSSAAAASAGVDGDRGTATSVVPSEPGTASGSTGKRGDINAVAFSGRLRLTSAAVGRST